MTDAPCKTCAGYRWLFKGQPHPGGDTRCPDCNTPPTVGETCAECGRTEFLYSMKVRGHADRYGHMFAPSAAPQETASHAARWGAPYGGSPNPNAPAVAGLPQGETP